MLLSKTLIFRPYNVLSICYFQVRTVEMPLCCLLKMRDIIEAPPRACAANFCVSTTPKREANWVCVEHSQHGASG